MTQNTPPAPRRVIDLGAMTLRQIARQLRCGIAQAEEHRSIARGEWCGDLLEIGEDGRTRPQHHGEFWNPGPGEARSDPWPDGTFGRQPRNRIRRWRKAWAAERLVRMGAVGLAPTPKG
jgi:hypothetical protein